MTRCSGIGGEAESFLGGALVSWVMERRVLEFTRPDPVRELQVYLDARFDRLDYLLGALAEAPLHVTRAQPSPDDLARILAYAPRRP